MNIDVLTLFPEMFAPVTTQSILGRANSNRILNINLWNIRDYTSDKHNKTDDTPFGGGAGMVMSAQPVFRCLNEIGARGKRMLYMSPRGRMLDQELIEELSEETDLVILCGHYEGVDQRILDFWGMEEVSVGDYVLTGGELPAMVLTDCVARMIPGVLSDEACFTEESHFSSLLEYPQYTRPAVWEGREVPEVLLSGHHERIAAWRREQSLLRTLAWRPDMLENAVLTPQEKLFLEGKKRKTN